MKSAFDNLRDNASHNVIFTRVSDKQVVKLYAQEKLIAKKN